MPRRVRASVVLPLPDSPTRPSVSPGQIAALTSTNACTSWPRCWNTLLSSSSGRVALAERSTFGQLEVGGLRARKLAAHARGTSSDSRARAPTVVERRLLGVAALVGERAAVCEHATGDLGAEAREEPRDRVEPAVILAHAAARDAAQQPDGVRVPRILRARSRPGPPRRAGRRRAPRRDRTSSRSRRGCG